MRKVAIQGGLGAYHGIAAENFFAGETLEIIPCPSFRDVFKVVDADPKVIGIMAIENTIAGSLLQNYELLRRGKFPICGEYKLRISHCLAAWPGRKLAEIKEIQSHPIALMQCESFLDRLPSVKVVKHEDTALAARDVREKALHDTAAICSARAAAIYGLEVLAEGIETNKHNFTRFLVFGHKESVADLLHEQLLTRASIAFTLPHHEGSLSKVLSVFSFYDINLTKIQSLPIIGREWEYMFYVDFAFGDRERFRQSLSAIRPLVSELQVLGEYPEGRQSLL